MELIDKKFKFLSYISELELKKNKIKIDTIKILRTKYGFEKQEANNNTLIQNELLINV